ncbi:outer membrane protein assembly factor BamE [Litorivicinus sp.]|nr:outer membrane protein assembly factor BamE [Litorivicinus sp.]
MKFWTSDEAPAIAEPTMDAAPSEETVVAPEPATTNYTVLELNADQLAKVEVGQTKDEVLEILGPAANVDRGTTLADHYIKGGEVYDVLYFRAQVDGVEELRALLFKEDQLVGIGWSGVN